LVAFVYVAMSLVIFGPIMFLLYNPTLCIYLFLAFSASLSGIILGTLLLKRKKLGWWLSLIYLITLFIFLLLLEKNIHFLFGTRYFP